MPIAHTHTHTHTTYLSIRLVDLVEAPTVQEQWDNFPFPPPSCSKPKLHRGSCWACSASLGLKEQPCDGEQQDYCTLFPIEVKKKKVRQSLPSLSVTKEQFAWSWHTSFMTTSKKSAIQVQYDNYNCEIHVWPLHFTSWLHQYRCSIQYSTTLKPIITCTQFETQYFISWLK